MKALFQSFVVTAFLILGLSGCDDLAEPTESQIEVIVAPQGKPCVSSADCPGDKGCTTESGDCNAAPGCKGDLCATVCYGFCTAREACGSTLCAAGDVCCNASCGICTPPGGVCTQQFCE